MGKLTVTKVRSAKPARDASGRAMLTRFADGQGLYLLVKPSGARSWILRVQADGRRRDIGLGAVDLDGAGREAFGRDDPLASLSLMQRKSLSLAEAREKAAALRKLAKAGADPVAERDKERRAIPTFAEAVTAAHEALAHGWAERTANAFRSSLLAHAVPRLGKQLFGRLAPVRLPGAALPAFRFWPILARPSRQGGARVGPSGSLLVLFWFARNQ